MYPRTVAITRPAAQSGVGQVGYGGETRAAETPVASGIPANIQLKKDGARLSEDLPGDIAKRSYWRVFIPGGSLANGVIHGRDIVTDDLGIRYQVASPYWNSLGYALFCEKVES